MRPQMTVGWSRGAGSPTCVQLTETEWTDGKPGKGVKWLARADYVKIFSIIKITKNTLTISLMLLFHISNCCRCSMDGM